MRTCGFVKCYLRSYLKQACSWVATHFFSSACFSEVIVQTANTSLLIGFFLEKKNKKHNDHFQSCIGMVFFLDGGRDINKIDADFLYCKHIICLHDYCERYFLTAANLEIPVA